MHADAAGARTRLLAAIALWSACVWLLALFGLGGRVAALPEDPALLQPIPQGTIGADARLGPFPQYAEIGDRPLFAADRRHRPFFLDPQGEGEEGPGEFDVVLTSVMITPGLQMAIVQPSGGGEPLRIRVGESPDGVPGWSLTSVGPRSAVFAGPEGERTLELRVFDGVGGQPPTPVVREEDDSRRRARRLPAPPAVAPARPATQAQHVDEDPEAEAAAAVAASAAAEAQAATEEITPAAQAEAIRKRIEARRARLRQEAQQQAAGQEQNP